MSACFCVTTTMMMMMTICHKFGHKRGIFLPHGFFTAPYSFIRLTICAVLWIAFPIRFLRARWRIKAHKPVSCPCVLSLKSLTPTNPCLECSPRSPKRSLFIKFSDKDCVQNAFRISSLHATCRASPSSICSPLAAIFTSLCMNFEASHYAVSSSLLLFRSKHYRLLTFIKVFTPCSSRNARDQVAQHAALWAVLYLHFGLCKYIRTE